MKNYQKLKTPEGFKEMAHFFVQEKGKPETRREHYWFEVDETGYAPCGLPVEKGEIICANAFVEDNYNKLRWYSGFESLANWFKRVVIEGKDKYEFFTEP
jgi:hypothetical protein